MKCTRRCFSQDAHLYLQKEVPGYENATTLVTELVQVFMASLHVIKIQKNKQTGKSIKDLTFPSSQETHCV